MKKNIQTLLHRDVKGITLVELMIYIALVAIVMTPLFSFFTRAFKGMTNSTNLITAQQAARFAFIHLEEDLNNANQIIAASSTAVDVICDIVQNPNWNLNALSVNGIPRYLDPDVDNDAGLILAPSQQWQAGYNLTDDDDDNDGHIDVRLRFWYDPVAKILYEDASYNEQAWGSHVQTLATHVSSFTFTYYGSKSGSNAYYPQLDLNGDGLVTAAEIDAAPGVGNNNGRLDTSQELQWVTSIGIHIEIDEVGNGLEVYKLDNEIAPPLLPLKSYPY